jgi:predicted MFS family arabinose efflux permease
VSVTAVAAGVTVFFLAGAVGSGPGGRLAERVGAPAAMRGCVLVTAVTLLAAALFARSLAVLLVMLVAAGLANAVSQPAINLFLAERVPLERQGLGFGIKQSAIPAAILVSGLALPAVALPLGWRPTFALCAVLALAVAAVMRRSSLMSRPEPRVPAPRPSRALIVIAVAAALASAAPNALGAYLVASAVDAGISEAAAGLLAALGSLFSLAMRVLLGLRADRRRDYGFTTIAALLIGGAAGFALLATETAAPFVAGALVAFALGWGWPGLFNLAVVNRHRDSPGAASGVSQAGIYVGAAGGPAAFGLLSTAGGYGLAYAASALTAVVAAGVLTLAGRLRG